MSSFVVKLTPSQAWDKIKTYCAYQERCHTEVKDKLYNYGLSRIDVEVLISRLIEENFLNEERFAQQYAGGHFRMKQWGRIKIIHALRQKGVSEYCIKKGLKEIDADDYEAVLQKMAAAKWSSTKGQPLARKAKTRDYLLQKGYEPQMVYEVLKGLSSDRN